jgi:hypothetical protein
MSDLKHMQNVTAMQQNGTKSRGHMSNKKFIDVTPKVNPYAQYRNYSYSLEFAIGELIDNSITSAYQNWEKLVAENGSDYYLSIYINFDADNKRITVEDNAAGITDSDFDRVLVAGEKPLESNHLSVFGVGLKMAAFWFGEALQISSRPIGENYISVASMSLAEMDQEGKLVASTRKAPRASLKPGTVIYLEKPYPERWPEANEIVAKSKLWSSMYRIYLANTVNPVRIFVNGTLLKFEPFPLMHEKFWPSNKGPKVGSNEKTWKQEFSMTTTDGFKITGWFGILSQIRRDVSGFFLHFRGKGMDGIGVGDSDESGNSSSNRRISNLYYRPFQIFGRDEGYRFGRFTGEFDISDFGKPVSSDEPRWTGKQQEEFETAVLTALKAGSEDFWSQASNFQPRTKKKLEEKAEDTDITETEIKEIGEVLFGDWNPDDAHHDEDVEADAPIKGLSSLGVGEVSEFEFVKVDDQEGHEHIIKLEIADEPNMELYSFHQDPDSKSDVHILRINAGHLVLRKFNWTSKQVRQATFSMALLMALPELFLPLRINRSHYRAKVNDIANALVEQVDTKSTEEE